MSSPAVEQICNYLPISESLGTAGQPTRQQFADVEAAGYRVVVNLAMPNSTNALPDEAQLVAEQGMDYVHIPVVWESPTLDDLERFFAVMDEYRGQKVLVHCALNMRVSCFVFLYRVVRRGVLLEVAWETLRRIWEPNDVWQSFIGQALAAYGIVSPSQRPGKEAI
jgi:protein tyrosine phosphatase (PTP) superfamily phosphohydrolase (DUF442 family)